MLAEYYVGELALSSTSTMRVRGGGRRGLGWGSRWQLAGW